MSILEIRVVPDPVLRQKCAPVTVFDDALATLVADMLETMYAAPGVGLAAPQVGIEQRLAVVDASVGKEPDAVHVLINPRIVDHGGTSLDSEGCLSIPELTEKVRRPEWIHVTGHDLQGQPVEQRLEGFEARAFCHEIDHLDGVLFIDHLRGLRRDRARRQMKKLGLL